MHNKKTVRCAPKMSLLECEMTILRHAIEANELATKSDNLNNPTIVKIVTILERFLKKKNLFVMEVQLLITYCQKNYNFMINLQRYPTTTFILEMHWMIL